MDRSRLELGLTLAGIAALVVGALLTAIETNPDLPPGTPVPQILIPGMNPGVDAYDFPVLGAVVVLLAMHVFDLPQTVRAAMAILTGLIGSYVAFWVVLGDSLVGFDAVFVPGPGWYLTVLGSALLVLAGGVGLWGVGLWGVWERDE